MCNFYIINYIDKSTFVVKWRLLNDQVIVKGNFASIIKLRLIYEININYLEWYKNKKSQNICNIACGIFFQCLLGIKKFDYDKIYIFV